MLEHFTIWHSYLKEISCHCLTGLYSNSWTAPKTQTHRIVSKKIFALSDCKCFSPYTYSTYWIFPLCFAINSLWKEPLPKLVVSWFFTHWWPDRSWVDGMPATWRNQRSLLLHWNHFWDSRYGDIHKNCLYATRRKWEMLHVLILPNAYFLTCGSKTHH